MFSSCDIDSIRNLKGVPMLFERVSGMRINFHKCDLIHMNLEEGRIHEIAHALNCPIGALPFKYFGVPIHYEKLKRDVIQPLVDKLLKRGNCWLTIVDWF
jgi:hypothetical protein